MRTWIAYGNASQWWREALIWAIGAMRHRRCRTAFTAWSGPYKYDDRERYLSSLVRRSAFALRQRDTFRAASKWSFWYRSLQETKLQRKAVKKQKEHETEVIKLNSEHKATVVSLNDRHSKEVADLNDHHAEEVASLNDHHAKEVTGLKDYHQKEIVDLEDLHHKAVAKQANEHQDKVQALQDAHQNEARQLRDDARKERTEHESAVLSMRSEHHEQVQHLTDSHEAEMRDVRGQHHSEVQDLRNHLEQTDDARAAAEREAARLQDEATRLQALWDARPPTPPPKPFTRDVGLHPRFAWPEPRPDAPSPQRVREASPTRIELSPARIEAPSPTRLDPTPTRKPPSPEAPPTLDRVTSQDSATQTKRARTPSSRSPPPHRERSLERSDDEAAPPPPTIKLRKSVGVGPAPPPSAQLLGHTAASKRWDQSRKRHQLEVQLENAKGWHSGSPEKRETFSKQGFLQELDKDAVPFDKEKARATGASSVGPTPPPTLTRASTVASAYGRDVKESPFPTLKLNPSSKLSRMASMP